MISRTNRAAPRATAALRVLLVENHADTREFLTLMLQELGHTVIVAESMGKALRVAARSGCDVLISDIGLPDGDGWELLNRLNLPRPMYAIAMSGFGTISDRKRSEAAGYRHHLVKPMGLEQLETILRSVAVELRSSGGQRHGARTSLDSG
jgi:CheY-like chemotaxis protein